MIVTNSNELKNLSVKYVSAHAHHIICEKIKNQFTEHEMDIFKRGRNGAHHNYRKNLNFAEYNDSTGFEAIVGYLFLKDIYYSLKLNLIVKSIAKDYKFEFDLNEILSNLVFSRIIYPSSKLKTYELSQKFIETPKYNLENIYRGLTYLNNNLDYIQKELYNNSKTTHLLFISQLCCFFYVIC